MKTTSYSTINFASIFKVVGVLLFIEAFMMSLSLPFSLYYGQDDLIPILYSVLITAGVGLSLVIFNRKKNSEIGKREGYIIVSVSWLCMTLFGALPFLVGGYIPHFTDAVFESMSGFTTTGASILNDIEAMPKGILFWRSMTHWIGGMGIIVLTLVFLPLLGVSGMKLYSAEVPGPTKEKIHPKVKETAKRLWLIYIFLTLIETVVLMFGEMDFFDAICHSFATMATGGFSTYNASVANMSAYSQYVIIFFMLLAGINFALHFCFLTGNFKKAVKDEELKFYLSIILLATLIITTGIFIHSNFIGDIEKTFRDALFQVVSIMTTTGFVSYDYLLWPTMCWLILFFLMFIGGMAGSTGGGMKVVRIAVLAKNSRLELKRMVHPNAIIPVRISNKVVSPNIIYKVMAFMIFYMLITAFSIIGMSLLGLDFDTAIGSVVASIGNIGPGIGGVGPVLNYALIPTIGKWILIFLMMLGRLEIFTVLILFSISFWKK